MKIFLLISLLATALLPAQEAPSRAVALEAQMAVQAMADEVRKGNFKVTIDRMYPRWKGRMAGRSGGEAALEKRLLEAMDKIKRGGVTIQSFTAAEPEIVKGVWRQKRVVDGESKYIPTEWMALVPTTTTLRVAAQGEVHRVQSDGFQVAVRPIDGGEWTFIDGRTLEMADLRAMFPSVPKDLELPKRGGRKL